MDIVGIASSIGGLVALIYGLIDAGRHGWSNPVALLAIGCGIAILAGFFTWERRLSHKPTGQPLLDVALFRAPSYTWGVILTTVAEFSIVGVLFTMPQYFQGVLGTNAMGSGLRLLPLIGGLVVGAAPSDRISRLVGAKVAVAAGFAMLAAGLLLGATTTVGASGIFIAMWTALAGAGMGLALATATAAALSELSQERSGVGSAALEALNSTGGPLSAAILGSVLSAVYLAHLNLSALPASAASAVRQSIFGAGTVAHKLAQPALLDSARVAFVHGMDLALLLSGCVALVGVLLAAIFLPRTIRSEAAVQSPAGEQPGALAVG
jgi:DHA2 family multidrug resistance protein-like MFS transporter